MRISNTNISMDLINYIRYVAALAWGPTKGPATPLKGSERKGSKLQRGRRSQAVLNQRKIREGGWLFSKERKMSHPNYFVDIERWRDAEEKRHRRAYRNYIIEQRAKLRKEWA